MADGYEARLARLLDRVRASVAERGWIVQGVAAGADGTGAYAYTVGLTRRRHPELVIRIDRPTPEEFAAAIWLLDFLADQVIHNGARFTAGDDAVVAHPGMAVQLRFGHAEAGACKIARRLYGEAVTALLAEAAAEVTPTTSDEDAPPP